MTSEWLHFAMLRAASWLAPADQRGEWLEEWRSELWYVPRRPATSFCLGAFRDALWLRRNNQSPVANTMIRLESPLQCLTYLAALAAASVFVMVRTGGARSLKLPPPHLGQAVIFQLSCLLLSAATILVLGNHLANRHPSPWASRLRRWIFLVLKIALVLPTVPCAFVVYRWIGPVPFAPLGLIATWILTFRWVFMDQRRRCPVCLQLLANPVRIGLPSQTFLEWYGAESMCPRGHGLLHVPEISNSCYGTRQWLRLDASWSGLFSEAAGVRQR